MEGVGMEALGAPCLVGEFVAWAVELRGVLKAGRCHPFAPSGRGS